MQRERIPHQKIRTIYNGIDLSRFAQCSHNGNSYKELLKIEDAELVVAAIGSLVPLKNQKLLIKVASKVLKRVPNVSFVLAGDGPLQTSLRRLTERLGISHKIHFLGNCNNIPSLLSCCDIFAHASQSEGMPNAMLEAMAAAKPVIVTDVDGCMEVIKSGENGFLVKSNDPDEMTEALLTLLRNSDLRQKMGMAGRKLVQERFTVERMVKKTEELYTNLLTKN
jgi:glycosyltransferase involved in cell wall biosynthesis